MVNHKILLSRLQNRYGVHGAALTWLKSYLRGRTQYVKIGNETSEPAYLERGVPQGSVLGPSLFSLYVGPIEDIVERLDRKVKKTLERLQKRGLTLISINILMVYHSYCAVIGYSTNGLSLILRCDWLLY
ncbi:hypothetical protein AC249_AIPGENE16229 [Exaiptasia diaphana]|nr:hypothetical protein AC249_AIPGENE16229 [Exaiptasia diaphana]